MSRVEAQGYVSGGLRLRSFEVGEAQVRAPWGVRRPPGGWNHHFYVLTGAPCRLLMNCFGDEIALSGLTVCMINDRNGHAFQDPLRTPISQLALPMSAGASPCFRVKSYGGTIGDLTSCFYIGGNFEVPAVNLPPRVVLNFETAPGWVHAIQSIKIEMLNGCADAAARLCEFLFLKTLQMHADRRTPPLPVMQHRRVIDSRIMRAIALVDQDIGRPWTLDTLAEAAGLSRARLTARWRAEIGISVFSYIAKRRLAEGAHHLTTTNLGVGAIATRIGFSSHSAFSTAFRRLYGRSPEEHRIQVRNGSLF